MSNFLFAETAFHHEGNYDYLLALIDLAKDAGCTGIKFQILLDIDEFMSTLHPNYNLIKGWLFNEEQWTKILNYADTQNLKIIAMPCDVQAVKMIQRLPFSIEYFDIHSVTFFDTHLLSAIKSTKKPLILGIGGRTLEEINFACQYFNDQLKVLMVGFQSFPSNLEDINLNKITILKSLFPNKLIGYADHTTYDSNYAIKSLEYAYLLGAEIFEKHITLNEGEKRTDYEAAVGKQKLVDIKKALDYLDKITLNRGFDALIFTDKEINYRNRQKIVVAQNDIEAGTLLDLDNITLKVVSINTEGYFRVEDALRKVTVTPIKKDEPITRGNITKHDK